MSYTELVEFKDGVPCNSHEFKNSWGGAARIWDTLYKKYLADPNRPFGTWLTMDNTQDLWDLGADKRLPLHERAAHVFTFDMVLVRRESFAEMAQHLRLFSSQNWVEGVDHLHDWADVFESSEADAIGLHATSVNQNPWEEHEYDDDSDTFTPFDYTKNNGFRWLDDVLRQ